MENQHSSQQSKLHNPHGDGSYIPMLDGWRAIAIVLVVLFHAIYHTDTSGYPHLGAVASIIGRLGALGVLVFFCISGYLITQRLLVESRGHGMFSLKAFYVKRAFRILPPLFVYLIVILLLFLAGMVRLGSRDLLAPVFLANYFQGSWYTSHFWSLSVEEHFYIFWPVCVVLFGWRRAFWVGVLLVIAVGVWRPLVVLHTPNSSALASKLQHTDMRLDYIMLGALVALSLEFYPVLTRMWLQRLGQPLGLLCILALLGITTRPAVLDLRSLQAILLTLMVCASTIANAPSLRALLSNKPMLFLGKVSYSIYIWQQFFLGDSSHTWWKSPPALPVKFASILVVAWVSYRFVERPFIRMGRRLLDKKSVTQP